MARSTAGRRYCCVCGRWCFTFVKKDDSPTSASDIVFRPGTTKVRHRKNVGYLCDEHADG